MTASLNLVVIGGGAGGMKAACKTARLQPRADITVLERGAIFSYSACGLPYFISGAVHDRKDLYSTPAGAERDVGFFEAVKNVKVRSRTEAISIDRANRSVEYRSLSDGRTGRMTYDKLVLATGARPIVPPIPGVDLANVFKVKQVEDAERIKVAVEGIETKRAVIIGGGLIGMEMAESLADCAFDVTLFEKLPRILPMLDSEIALLVEKHLDDQGITVRTGAEITALEGEEGHVRAVVCGSERLDTDLVILAMGVRPNSDLAESAGIELGRLGGIQVDRRMRTSDPDIYAAGDCVECTHLLTSEPCYIPLGSTANKQGRVAAMNICGEDDEFPGVLGSTVLKVCDFTVGCTGLTEKQAQDHGYETISSLCPMPDRTHYYPGAKGVLLKLVAERGTGKLIGVQAVGAGEIAKRIDSAVAALTAGMTVEQVSKLDLCYAPPYASAMDNLITAANVLRNKMENRMVGVASSEVRQKLEDSEDFFLLDVRSPGEVSKAAIPGAVNIPLGKLRGGLDKVPSDKPVVCFCQLSLRGYEAAIILKAAGRENVTVMDGGVAMWPYETVRGG